MKRRNAGFEDRERTRFSDFIHAENRAAAIADIQILFSIERDSGRDPHPFRVRRHRSVGSDFVHRAVVARGNIHLAGAIESDAGAGHPLGFQIRINTAGLPMLQPAQDVLAPIGANMVNLIRDSPGADISPLAAKGVPAFGLWSDGRKYFYYHHTAADTLDKIDPQELREQGAAMAVMGYALASMPETLPR